jgi:hypothetical protein
MRVRALKYYYHDKTEHQVGDEFEMDDRQVSDINILCLIGTLEKIVGEAHAKPAPTPEPVARAMEPEVESTADEPETATRKYYRRRDMRAEK